MVETLHAELPRLLDAQARSQLDIQAVRWTQAGVPREIASRVAALDTLFAALDIGEIAETTRQMAEVIAQHTSRPVEQVMEDIDRDRFMTPAEAIDYGLIDAVLEPQAVRREATNGDH